MGSRRLIPTAVLAAFALVTGACTGDSDIEVLVDDDTDPSVLLGEAIERAEGLSGRFIETVVMDFSGVDWFDDESGTEQAGSVDRVEVSVEGEFAGEDVRATLTVDEDGEVSEHEWRVVDGRAYRTVDPEMDHEVIDELGGRTWVEERLHESLEGDDTLLAFGFLADGRPSDPAGLLALIERSAEQVVILGEAEIDGTSHRRLGARIGGMEESWLSAAALDEESRARADRIAAYGQQRLGADVEVWVDDDGLVRRLVTTSVDEVEPQYRECVLFMSFAGWSSTAEFFDVGARVEIVAPDPSDTVPLDEYDALMGLTGWDEEGAWDDDADWETLADWDGEGEPPLPGWRSGDHELTWEWTDADREYLEEHLAAYAPLLGVDPGALSQLSLDELTGLEEQLQALIDELPTYDTPLGMHDEYSLRSMVRMGMEWQDVDPALADDLTPEQLVELVEGYLSNPDNAAGPMVGLDDGNLFEGCPG